MTVCAQARCGAGTTAVTKNNVTTAAHAARTKLSMLNNPEDRAKWRAANAPPRLQSQSNLKVTARRGHPDCR